MSDTTQAAAVEAPAVTLAQFAEMQTALDKAKAEIAAGRKREAERDMQALFAELSTDAGHGALPVPALREAGLERLMLAPQGFASFAEGEDAYALVQKVLRAIHKSGLARMAPKDAALAADYADTISQEYERLPAAAKQALTLDEYRKGAVR